MKHILQKLLPIVFLCIGFSSFSQSKLAFITDFKFDTVYPLPVAKGMLAGLVTDKWLYIDKTGKPYDYSIKTYYPQPFSSNGLVASFNGEKCGYVDKSGNTRINYQFMNARGFAPNGLAAVSNGKRWGFIDSTGKLVIDYQFDLIYDFKPNGLAAFVKGNKFRYIDRTGKVINDLPFDYVEDFSNGYAVAKKGGKWGFIDEAGNVVIDFKYDFADSFSPEGYALLWNKNKYGFIDRAGNIVFEYPYQNCRGFVNGFASVKKDGRFGFIDKTFKVAVDYLYAAAGDFHNGLAWVIKDKQGKYGYIDTIGKLVMDYQFDDASDFNDGFARVKKGGKYGYIDKNGNMAIDFQFNNAIDFVEGMAAVKKGEKWAFIKIHTPLDDITDYINTEILKWQEKGKFETSEAYQARVTESNRKKKLEEISNIAVQQVANKYCDWKTIATEYDADNQTFKVNVKGLQPFYIKVPISEAESFDKSTSSIQTKNLEYALNSENKFFLQKAIIKNPDNSKEYSYSSGDKATFAYTQLNMNFEPLNISVKTTEANQVVKTDTKSLSVGLSEVDLNIPINPQTNDKTFAVIIANENYQKEVKVQYALNDGKVFKEYCEKTLGIPSKNIHFAQDASFGNMKSEIKWISDVMAAFNGKAKVIFYYAGHGMPNESNKTAYLLPVDGFSSDFETAISLNDLYDRLTASPSQSVTVFLDACFSGSVRENGMLANARGVKIRPKVEALKGNLVVFTAATGDETAYPYKEKQHGLFTYYLLKKLQDTKGNVDYQTLSNYITENVKQQSIVVNQKSQTPQVNTSISIQNLWPTMKIK